MQNPDQIKHTPGPWRYHLGRGVSPRFHVQTEGGYQIASTTELTTRNTAKLAADFDENKAREANARLIAAAPSLLEACKAVLVWGGYLSPAKTGIGLPTEKEAMDKALAAIAQAEVEV